MKKWLIALWCVILLILLALTYNYIRTSKAALHFYNDMLRMSDLSELGFINPYKDHFNKGTAHYSEADYVKAEEEFRKALESHHPDDEDKDCRIRINLALSMVKPLTRESINAENVDIAIEILKEARSILCENGCADMEDKEWHNDDAQTLKKEIDEYIKELEEQKEQQQQNQDDQNNNGGGGGGGSDDQNNGGNDDNNGGGDDDNNGDDQNNNGGGDENEPKPPGSDVLDQLDGIQNDGLNERNNINNYEYQYYGGKPW